MRNLITLYISLCILLILGVGITQIESTSVDIVVNVNNNNNNHNHHPYQHHNKHKVHPKLKHIISKNEGDEDDEPTVQSSAPISLDDEDNDMHNTTIQRFPIVGAGKNYGSWMKDNMGLLQDLTLHDILLPGTHDSGAYWLNKNFMGPIGTGNSVANEIFKIAGKLHIPASSLAVKFGMAQSRNLYDQGVAGARYFDVRCAWDGKSSTWYTYHFQMGHPVETLFKDLRKFIQYHTSEIIVIELGQFYGKPNPDTKAREKLKQLVYQYFRGYMLPTKYNYDTLTIKEMILRKYRVIVTFDMPVDVKTDEFIHTGEAIINTWANSDNLDNMHKFNDGKINEFNQKRIPANRLYKVSYTLTPCSALMLKLVNPFNKIRSLKDLAKKANNKFVEFFSSKLNKKQRIAHILIMDFIGDLDPMPTVMKINQLHAKIKAPSASNAVNKYCARVPCD